jgi:hypothetical protein
MDETKVSAYGGIFTTTKKQYIKVQAGVFAVLLILFFLTFIYDFDRFAFGSARATLLIVALLEVIEMIYIFRKFKK